MSALEPLALADYQAFFEASPDVLFVLSAEEDYPIVAVSDGFLRGTMKARETALGRGLFDVFPAEPGSRNAESMQAVLAVLERVCHTGQPETVPTYRYDIPWPGADGGLEERHWQMSLRPTQPNAEGKPRFILGRSVDLTTKVFAEREIKDARARLEATLGAAEIGTWIWEVAENRVFADRNLARLFNVSDADAEGGAIEQYTAAIHEEDRARVQQAIETASRAGERYEVEYRLVRPEGGYRWVVARGRAERDPATGVVTRFPGVVLDITGRRQAEDTARASAESLRIALESAHLGTWEYLPLTGKLTWSDTCRAMFGVAPGTLVTYEGTFLPGLHPDDREKTGAAVARALGAGSSGSYAVEFRAIGLGDGVERWISSRGRAFFSEVGQCERFIGTVLNVTERKQAEQAAERRSEQLRQLAATSARLNTTLDVRSVLGVITAEARQLIGARHAVTTAAPVGAMGSDIPPLTVASHAEDDVPSGPAEAVQSAALSVPLLGQGDQRIGVIELTSKEAGGFTSDDAALLTQLAQIAARAIENARLYDALRANDKRKDEFLAMLAHELRNPLAAIRNAVALSSDTEDAEDIAWAMEVIQRQIRQLSRMIDDLLDVSRITQGMVQLRKERLDAAEIFRRAVDTAGGLITERGHTLKTDVPAGEFFVEADASRLEQALVNLLTNSAKYTDKGGEIVLSARHDGEHVALSVRDNGKGIPPDKLPQMFELFAQGDRSLARSEGGLGIGLTVVRSLVELHGGTVHATSGGPGQGSEFTLRLPATLGDKPRPVAAPAAASGDPAETPKVRVLVVDDNEDSARAVARLIARQGYDVEVAYDGPKAVEMALARHPEFVFLDIGLPGMNGYEVATRLRQEEGLKKAMLVAVSGYGEESDRRRSREAGFDQHLVKPVDPGALLALLKEE